MPSFQATVLRVLTTSLPYYAACTRCRRKTAVDTNHRAHCRPCKRENVPVWYRFRLALVVSDATSDSRPREIVMFGKTLDKAFGGPAEYVASLVSSSAYPPDLVQSALSLFFLGKSFTFSIPSSSISSTLSSSSSSSATTTTSRFMAHTAQSLLRPSHMVSLSQITADPCVVTLAPSPANTFTISILELIQSCALAVSSSLPSYSQDETNQTVSSPTTHPVPSPSRGHRSRLNPLSPGYSPASGRAVTDTISQVPLSLGMGSMTTPVRSKIRTPRRVAQPSKATPLITPMRLTPRSTSKRLGSDSPSLASLLKTLANYRTPRVSTPASALAKIYKKRRILTPTTRSTNIAAPPRAVATAASPVIARSSYGSPLAHHDPASPSFSIAETPPHKIPKSTGKLSHLNPDENHDVRIGVIDFTLSALSPGPSPSPTNTSTPKHRANSGGNPDHNPDRNPDYSPTHGWNITSFTSP